MKTYASKLLLFGEYTIINGSRALATPYATYAGHWTPGRVPDKRLLAFSEYLNQQAQLRHALDVAAFRQDLQQGLYFASNIPVGYGLGSSGALCAAVYDRYARSPVGRRETERFGELRRELALMESHFHGSSSGIDPLISYLEHPAVISPEDAIDLVRLPDMQASALTFFLLDTGISRATGPLVKIYLANYEDPGYAGAISGQLLPLVDALIDNFLQADWSRVGVGMRSLSEFQWEYFRAMIPHDLHPIWKKGLDSGAYHLKLCGAGGGGFILGVTDGAGVPESLQEEYSCLIFAPHHSSEP